MKKISILALVIILVASLAGCWRRKPEPTTTPSTVAPTGYTTMPTTAPTVPSTTATVPYTHPSTQATEGMLPGMDGTTDHTGTGSVPAETTMPNRSRSMPKY